MLETLAELWIRGVDVDWTGFDRHATRRKVALPTSPFERARYWLAPSSPAAARSSASGRSSGHPLLGRRLRSAGRGAQFEAELGAGSTAYLEDHRVHDVAVLPATGFVEMFLAAGARVLGSAACRVEDLTLQEALVLPEQGGCTVQLVAGPIADGRMPCEVWSLVADEDRDDAWRLHAIGHGARRRRQRASCRGACRDPGALHRGDGAGQALRGHASARRRASRRVLRRRRPVAGRRRGARGGAAARRRRRRGLRSPPGAARRLPAADRRGAA